MGASRLGVLIGVLSGVSSGAVPRCFGMSFLGWMCWEALWFLTFLTKVFGCHRIPFDFRSRSRGQKNARPRAHFSQYSLALLVLTGWAPVPARPLNWCFFVLAPVLYSSGAFVIVMGALWPGLGSSSLAQLEERTSACRLACM